MPEWLMALNFEDDRLPIAEILQGSVFYPASGMHGLPVKSFSGYAHSFVYADWNISQDLLTRHLDTFKGYKLAHSRSVCQADLCFKPFQPILPDPSDGDIARQHIRDDFSPYALWTVFDRLPEFTEVHGPERFSLLFVGGDGVATFQSLYYSNQCAPSVVVLIRCDGFSGNWTSFFNPKKIFARSVMNNLYGAPEYIFCDNDFNWPCSPWPWYSKLHHTVTVPDDNLRLWGQGLE
jgi:hypothetical protein